MTLQDILDQIANGKLLPAEMFLELDLDSILDQRDEKVFEQPWLECSERIEAAWNLKAPDGATQELMDQVRKESFLAVSRATSQHEIASYVSDDFGLISKSILLGINDTYANGLFEVYCQGKLPR
ncbi:MAG: hypothetical protein COA78_16790 [Blastopirellula sp.]|nr:MAG: hypothetical protein COA78_16790 [Blastopirellula sp.]